MRGAGVAGRCGDRNSQDLTLLMLEVGQRLDEERLGKPGVCRARPRRYRPAAARRQARGPGGPRQWPCALARRKSPPYGEVVGVGILPASQDRAPSKRCPTTRWLEAKRDRGPDA